ncbi:MAG: hypothetical protein NXI13_02520 [Proteobacteria bacterium]|nr:hypothetical protein [Pseudomonadota bacterium]
MTLITETGDGVDGATSYISLAEADSHFTALAKNTWTSAVSAAREEALTRASLHIDSYDYPGEILSLSQGLKWPRSKAYDSDGRRITGLPHALRTATLELALIFIENSDGLDGRSPIKQKIGPVELTYDRARGGSFVFRLLSRIGARSPSQTLTRG